MAITTATQKSQNGEWMGKWMCVIQPAKWFSVIRKEKLHQATVHQSGIYQSDHLFYLCYLYSTLSSLAAIRSHARVTITITKTGKIIEIYQEPSYRPYVRGPFLDFETLFNNSFLPASHFIFFVYMLFINIQKDFPSMAIYFAPSLSQKCFLIPPSRGVGSIQ